MGKEKKIQIRNSAAEFLIFTRQAGEDGIEVRVAEETVWLTQKLMAALFDVTVPTISEHLANLHAQKEISPAATIRNFRTVQKEGSREVARNVEFHNLDAIIAVGFRVNSGRAIQFRQWAAGVLRDYAIRGMGELKAELVLDCRHELAEGPVWHEGLLWWVNINAGELHRLDPATLRHDERRIGGTVGCAVPCADGRWLAAHGGSLSFVDWESGAATPLCEVEDHLPRNRLNDGKCDPQGRFWFGSMNLDQSAATGALYVLEGGLPPRQVLTGRMISNGLAWSPDHRTLYHTDSWTRRIDAFDYEPETAAISAPKALVEFPGGVFPDGMAMDAEGNLWVALWGGGAVVRIDTRTGRELARITLPVSQPSSCAFGGPALDALYITTAHEHLDASTRTRQPLAGGIFCAHPGVCGLPVTLFTGPPDLDHSSFYPGRAERS